MQRFTQDDPALQSALEACNNYTKASITYTFGSQTTTLNGRHDQRLAAV